MAFAEGSANDWLRADGGRSWICPTSGSLILPDLRWGDRWPFTGGWFIDRYSRVTVVRASALMGALGISLIILPTALGWQEFPLFCGDSVHHSASC